MFFLFERTRSKYLKNGVLVVEDPYVGSVLKLNSYDQFYDEHVYVFSLMAISNIIKSSNLRIFDAEKINAHGGSMRYYICKELSRFKPTKRFKILYKKEIKYNEIISEKEDVITDLKEN